MNRTNPERGIAADFPTCLRCPDGRALRAALERAGVRVAWHGAGLYGRFERGRADAPDQRAAYERLRRAGLLDEPPTLDAPPAEESGAVAAP